METVTARRTWLFAAAWVLGTTLALLISGFLFHFPGALPPNNGEAFNAEGATGAVINGLATGIIVGVGQKFLMQVIGVISWRWAVNTAVALWLIHTVCDVFPDSLAQPLMTFLGGLLIGGVQWWALRMPARYGTYWLMATAFSWTAGMWLSGLVSAGSDWRTEHLMSGLWVGLLLGVATASVWFWMLSDRSQHSSTTSSVFGKMK